MLLNLSKPWRMLQKTKCFAFFANLFKVVARNQSQKKFSVNQIRTKYEEQPLFKTYGS